LLLAAAPAWQQQQQRRQRRHSPSSSLHTTDSSQRRSAEQIQSSNVQLPRLTHNKQASGRLAVSSVADNIGHLSEFFRPHMMAFQRTRSSSKLRILLLGAAEVGKTGKYMPCY